jgi:4-amino-4-deoxy-L-arabinose transferase-like glycosyltransferase
LGYSRRVKLIALFIGLVCPFIPIYAGFILTEVLATFFVTLACYSFIKVTVKDDLKSLVFAGFASGMCMLVRPDTLPVVIFMIFATVLASWHYHKQKSLIKISVVSITILLTLLPWTIRNYYYFHALRPLGLVTAQVDFPYTKWLDTWLDDPKDFDTYWWRAIKKESTHEIPKDKMPDVERIKAESALFLAKQQGTFEGQPAEDFLALANEAKQVRPFKTIIITRVRRTVMTWIRMPTYIEQYYLKILAYPFWLILLLLTTLGSISIRKNRSYLFLILYAVILGRLALPLISSLAIEPRYMLEALPVCFIFASIGALEMHARIFTLISRKHQ